MIDRRMLFPGLEVRPASGRAHEFRLVGTQLHQLDPDGTWRPYVPFARVKESLPPRALTEAEFLADFERLWEGRARNPAPRRTYISRCTQCGRAGHNRRGCQERAA